MGERPSVESILERHRFSDYRWLDPAAIIVAQWVRMKCQFGCPHFGRAACCPPNAPDVDACRDFFGGYRRALLFHFQNSLSESGERHAWSAQTNRALVSLEREVFLAGNPKAFALFADSCHLCDECVPLKRDCRQPALARPPATAMAVDVFGTARDAGFSAAVLTEAGAPADYFAFLMVD